MKTPVFVTTNNGAARALTGSSEPAPISMFPVHKKADLAGYVGRAWLTDQAAGHRILKVNAAQDGVLNHWVVEAPWAHPIWHSYSIVLVHLRPLPGISEQAKFYLDGATHEFWIFAMDPSKDRNELIRTGIVKGHWLQPKNYADQFIAESDDEAIRRIKGAVQEVVDGKLSPDVDYQRDWIQRFGGSMMKKEYR